MTHLNLLNYYHLKFRFNPPCYYSTNNNESDNITLPNNISDSTNINIPDTTNINVNLSTDSLTLISETLKTAGHALETYVPVISGAAAAAGTATILKTLPPSQRVGAIGIAGAVCAGTSLLSQGLIINNKNNQSIQQDNEPIENYVRPHTPVQDSNTFVNSLIEEFNLIEIYNYVTSSNDPSLYFSLAIFIFSLGGLYALTTMIINNLLKLTNFENSKFVTSKPKLHKFISYLSKVNQLGSFILLILVWIVFVLILYSSYHLLTVLMR